MNHTFLNDECSKSELDLVRKPLIQTAIEGSTWDKIEPSNNWDSNSTLEFIISGSNDKYIDLSSIQLFLELSITKNDKTGLPADVPVSVTNNLLHSLFKNIETRINTSTVSNYSDKYPYKAYFENLLGYNQESKKILLRGDCWFKDTDGDFDTFLIKDDKDDKSVVTRRANTGFISRNLVISDGKPFELCGNLHLDICTADKLILNNNDVTLLLKKHDNSFIFLGDTNICKDFRINYLKAHILIRRVQVAPSVMLANTFSLEKLPAQYPLKRVEIKDIVGEFKSTTASFKNIATGTMPIRVVVGFVETEAFSGKFEKNPYNFQNFGIKSAELKVNSKVLPFSSKLEFNFKAKNYFQAYSTLFKCIKDAPNDISYEEYPNGNFILAFNLSPDLCTENHLSLSQDGRLELKIELDAALDKSITGIFYLEYDNLLQLTKQGSLILDYTA